MKISNFLIISSLATVSAFSVNRREAGAAVAAAFVGVVVPKESYAIDSCKPGANNCVQGSWATPSGAEKSAIVDDLKAAISAYPQEGQNEVDGGGWAIAEDNFGSGVSRVEYRSSGKGTFAKFFNGGKPFVDDLKLEIVDGVVYYKSASRVGDSDFGKVFYWICFSTSFMDIVPL